MGKFQWFQRDNTTTYILRKHKSGSNIINNMLLLIIIMFLCTIASVFFRHMKISESNIVMIYLLGNLIFSFLAEGYLYSFIASIFGVLLYNFFFTEPYYTLQVYNNDYPITFIVMFIVGFLTSMLTIRVKIERQLVIDREEYISSLYYIEKRLLDVKSMEELAKVSSEEIFKHFKADVLVQFFSSSGEVTCRVANGEDVFGGEADRLAAMETYRSGNSCGFGTNLFSFAKAYYTPIISSNGVAGVIGLSVPKSQVLSDTQKAFIDVISPQIAVVLERERIYQKEQETQVEIQKERLRADMLRSISHDFRTPLTGIMGLASTMLNNFERMNDEVKKNFLQSIYEDSDWLNELVENILQTTRFEEGRAKLNLEEEAAEEIITNAVTHVNKHNMDHKIIVKIPEEIIIVRMDGVLIRQVLVNLLNNAINYSPPASEIIVSLKREDYRVIFEVEDNGPGIEKEEMPHIFERYYRRNTKNNVNRKGMGIGLSLCKSIVEAHNGRIFIKNKKPKGLLVSFYVYAEVEEAEWNQ